MATPITLTRKANTPTELTVDLPLSKSECNRVLIIKALANLTIEHSDISSANDSIVLHHALQHPENEIDCEDAGTVMRFLTAYFAIKKDTTTILKGTERMHQRPIKPLVDALLDLGAEIEYLDKEGFPPLKITGKKLKNNKLRIDASISSQFISALMLIGPMLPNGLEITFESTPISFPYIELTAAIMCNFGASIQVKNTSISITNSRYTASNYKPEADWSAASYWYELATFFPETTFQLNGLRIPSNQGDAVLPELFKPLGISTVINETGISICKNSSTQLIANEIDCTNFPDLAQTLACTYAGLNANIALTGLKTLALKETNRIEAIQHELHKIGIDIETNGNSWSISSSISQLAAIEFNTYKDHRMAMSLAPLAAYINQVTIEDSSVVNKSYPDFWNQISQLFDIQQLINC